MHDTFYPPVDITFIDEQIRNSGKIVLDSTTKVGNTTAYVMDGSQAIHKRLILIREIDTGMVSFEIATGMAIRFGFMGPLLKWLELHRNWKDGAYIT